MIRIQLVALINSYIIYTFTLQVLDNQTHNLLYTEYHNFKRYYDSWVYYRGGAVLPLEIELSELAALEAMSRLLRAGWTCDNPKVVEISA